LDLTFATYLAANSRNANVRIAASADFNRGPA
jgi:hypothetical protein